MKARRNTLQVIEQTVAKMLPAGDSFKIIKDPIRFKGERHILRVITPSMKWGKMDKMDRFSKMQDAILPELTPQEKKKIFRISVLTPIEWEEIKKDRPKAKVVSYGATSGQSRPKAAPAQKKTSGVRKQKANVVLK